MKELFNQFGAAGVLGIVIGFFLFFGWLVDRIQQKAGTSSNRVYCYIPIVQFCILFRIANMNPFWALVSIIPILGPILGFCSILFMMTRLTQFNGKSGFLVLLLFVPAIPGFHFVGSFAFPAYLFWLGMPASAQATVAGPNSASDLELAGPVQAKPMAPRPPMAVVGKGGKLVSRKIRKAA